MSLRVTGLKNGDAIGAVDMTTNAVRSSSGFYSASETPWAITPTHPTGGSFSSNDYQITYVAGSLRVDPKAILFTGIAANEKEYDGTNSATLNAAAIEATGLVAGDHVNVSLETATGVFSDANAGAHKNVTVTGAVLTGADARNYAASYAASGTITPKTLQVVAQGAGKTVGAFDPTLTYRYYGLANGEQTASFSGGLSRASGETVGQYLINVGTLQALGNYTIGTFVPAYLAISENTTPPAPVSPQPVLPVLQTIVTRAATDVPMAQNAVVIASAGALPHNGQIQLDAALLQSGVAVSQPAPSVIVVSSLAVPAEVHQLEPAAHLAPLAPSGEAVISFLSGLSQVDMTLAQQLGLRL